MAFDIKLFYFFNNFAGKSALFDALIVFLVSYFPLIIIAAFLLLLYFSAYAKKEKLNIFWATFVSAVAARFVITEIIRFFYYRPRPFLAHELNQLIYTSVNTGSFPSGHSAFFFAMATAVYLYNKKWGSGFFIAAILMNVSRVIAGAHYPSDILGGAAIGMLTGFVVYKLWQKYFYLKAL